MIMSSNNYMAPYYFTQPPPSYSLSNYNWQLHAGHSVRGGQNGKNSSAPPLPPGPPPPPPPPSNPRPPSHPSVSSASAEQRSQSYYSNSSSQGSYRSRRYNSSSRQYSNSSNQYAALSSGQYGGHYSSGHQYVSYIGSQNYARMFYGKRKPEVDPEGLKKANKKKKKPLSQNIPQRKDWSVQDAKRALTVEKEYNKRHRSQSLIIKFPDLELNRDIVSKFHSSIDSVHFQQPSTPRFCFVTLKESADPDGVIKELNEIPFGQGFLSAEYKKDREDEINIGPEDIDPLTLYVGNLAQEITKEDMVNTYPKQKRIDIGYAKKMKYTRYAFVSFKNVDDSIEAFRKTHATQMYSKSLIVRFRRLNGTVGMPGEPKPQMPQRGDSCENHRGHMNSNGDHSCGDHNDLDGHGHLSDMDTDSNASSRPAPWEMVDVSQWETDAYRRMDLMCVKEEPMVDSDYEDEDLLPSPRQYRSSYSRGSMEMPYSMHKNFIPKIKKERNYDDDDWSSSSMREISDMQSADWGRHRTMRHNDDSERGFIPPDRIKKEVDSNFNENAYDTLKQRHPQALGQVSVDIKKEASPVPERRERAPPVPREVMPEPPLPPVPREVMPEPPLPPVPREVTPEPPPPPPPPESVPVKEQSIQSSEVHSASMDEPPIKTEPLDKDDENDADRDDSSDGSEDNISSILCNIRNGSTRLKKWKSKV